MPTYLSQVNNFTHIAALQINSFFMLLLICLILFFGYCADFISRKFLLILSYILIFALAYPLFIMLSSNSLWQACIAMGILTIIFSIFIPAAFVCMVEAFSTSVRYTGLSLGFNTGLAVFGGTCPLVATWLIEVTKNSTAPAFYMMLFAIIALITTVYIKDKRGMTI